MMFFSPSSAQIAVLCLSQQSSPSPGSHLAQLSTYKGKWQGTIDTTARKSGRWYSRERKGKRSKQENDRRTEVSKAFLGVGSGQWGMQGPFCHLSLIGFLFHYQTMCWLCTLVAPCRLTIRLWLTLKHTLLKHALIYMQTCLYFNIVYSSSALFFKKQKSALCQCTDLTFHKPTACRDLPPSDKRVNILPASLMSKAWKENDCREGKDSSCLDDVETTCPFKFLSQTHCSPRGQSKQVCQTQLASHYRHTMAPCVWGPTKMFPRFSLVSPSLHWQGISL